MENKSKYTKTQRISALICIIVIVLMYLAALVFSLLKFEWAGNVARIAIGCTVVLPLLTWVYIWLSGYIFHKHTIADLDLMGNPTNHDPVITADTSDSPEK